MGLDNPFPKTDIADLFLGDLEVEYALEMFSLFMASIVKEVIKTPSKVTARFRRTHWSLLEVCPKNHCRNSFVNILINGLTRHAPKLSAIRYFAEKVDISAFYNARFLPLMTTRADEFV